MKKFFKVIAIGMAVLFIVSLVHLKVSININSKDKEPKMGSFDWYYLNMVNSPNNFDDALRHLPIGVKGDSQKLLDDKLSPLVKVLETLKIDKLKKEQLFDTATRCHMLSNCLSSIARKLLKDKQPDRRKFYILELSARIMRVMRRVRNFIPEASTPWLSVLYNDIYLNILVKINDIVYDDECNTSESVSYDINDILFRLNEAVDPNIYTNTLEEIEYDNKELVKKLYAKLERLGYYNAKHAQTEQKFLTHIKEFVSDKETGAGEGI